MDNHETAKSHSDMITPPENLQAQPAPEAEPTAGQFLARNSPLLVVVAVLLAGGLWYFQISLGTVGKVAIGLGLVIFIHELGHFLVAKWCDVHVTTFSIGFGPAIPGCSFQWGETNYRLALFPLGGYVQMVGQVDGDESSDGNEDDPRSYRNKTVWQRMAIISAGVVMNVILAIICFVIVFQGPGKDRGVTLVSAVDSASPAFKNGIRWEAEILKIGNVNNPYWENLVAVVMSSEHDEKVDLAYKRPQDKELTLLKIEPMLSKGQDSRPMIGMSPAMRAVLAARRDVPASFKHPVGPHTVAAQVESKIQFGDRIIATSDPNDPSKMKDLPKDPRKPDQRDYFEYLRRMQLLAGKDVTLRLERKVADKETETVEVKVPPAFHYTFGARMQMGQIVALREGSPAAKAGVRVRENGHEGDVILEVEVREDDGKTITRWGQGSPLDPVRLPFELKQWAARVSKAKPNPRPDDFKVILRVATNNSPLPNETRKLIWDQDWQFDRVLPFNPGGSPQAIPELGLAYQVLTTVTYPSKEKGNPDGLIKDDEIKRVRFYQLSEEGDWKAGKWTDLDPEDFAWVFYSFQFPGYFDAQKIAFQVKRDNKEIEIEIEARKDVTWPLSERGLIFSRDVRRQKADSFFAAVGLGFQDTYDNMRQVYQNLRGIITRRISIKNLGGPITIAHVAYRIAGYDFWEFIFFIGMISVNLAVINFLPIPVLDGGHMVFLIYEKIRGKPASEGVRVATTYAGLVLILSLMIFVIYMDISRLFRG